MPPLGPDVCRSRLRVTGANREVSPSLRQGSKRSTCLRLGAFSLAALDSLYQNGLRVRGLETDNFEGSIHIRMIPAFGLFDTFKFQDHQPVGMPIPFQGFNGS